MKNQVLKQVCDKYLIARIKEDGTVHEYVCCSFYSKETDDWCWGHYFGNLEDAVEYFMYENYFTCPVCGKQIQKQEGLWTRDCHGIEFRHVCPGCYEKLMEKGYDGKYYTEAEECIDYDY